MKITTSVIALYYIYYHFHCVTYLINYCWKKVSQWIINMMWYPREQQCLRNRVWKAASPIILLMRISQYQDHNLGARHSAVIRGQQKNSFSLNTTGNRPESPSGFCFIKSRQSFAWLTWPTYKLEQHSKWTRYWCRGSLHFRESESLMSPIRACAVEGERTGGHPGAPNCNLQPGFQTGLALAGSWKGKLVIREAMEKQAFWNCTFEVSYMSLQDLNIFLSCVFKANINYF